ncbi:hypothetical protein COCC4DRAFT_31207 [Bipolaris maydis ATCC 48331]|uniref:Uncharacterized protein n=2 Tax=Cochliobolus heterostrophus TaxID=5016 RepID=M2V049_COCH5|nr:uncharacterized protein COCC4DRAFT_31207 [Bipolaris maydis ATCC 48331]EMD93398.1 hypothetical protein COCHEDRAFT_1020496 [Bipolaris maydis C5]ENI07154.1 hypothetical protein COCC4DRAFT_31207 [Bipolaris maydis ATCC 48331]
MKDEEQTISENKRKRKRQLMRRTSYASPLNFRIRTLDKAVNDATTQQQLVLHRQLHHVHLVLSFHHV